VDKKYYSLKRVFELHFRIGLLISLVTFILGFIFFPEIEHNNTQDFFLNPYIDPYFENNPYIIPNDTSYIKLIRIKELNPIIPLDRPIDDEPKPIKITFQGFVPYEVPPKPLNLDEINFEYPEYLRNSGIEGTVYLELLIDKKGNVRNVILRKSIHPGLDKIAVENAWKLKFSPAMQREKPVMVWYAFPVKFKLK